MKREVLITIIGSQFAEDGNGDPIEVVTAGEYFHKRDHHFVLFDEVIEGTEGITKSSVKFNAREVFLKRSGASSVQLAYELGKKTRNSYQTPYGSLMLGMDTTHLELEETEDRILLTVDYALDANYEFLADCTLRLEIRPREQGIHLTED